MEDENPEQSLALFGTYRAESKGIRQTTGSGEGERPIEVVKSSTSHVPVEGVPRYRLKAIERPSMESLKPEYLLAYLHFLDLTLSARRWAAANPALARRLGIEDL